MVRFGGMFVLVTGVLFALDVVPETHVRAEPTATSTTERISTPVVVEVPERTTPTRVHIARIGVDTTIVTPQSTDIAVLDRALLSGAVHYPGTCRL
jgi:hypothetical protein